MLARSQGEVQLEVGGYRNDRGEDIRYCLQHNWWRRRRRKVRCENQGAGRSQSAVHTRRRSLGRQVTPTQYEEERIARQDVQKLLRKVKVFPDKAFSDS